MPSRMKRDLMQGIFDAILVLTALLCSLLCFADLIPEEIGLDVAPACRMAVLAGLVALIYGIRSLVQKDSSGLYFLLLGLAAIFLFSGLHVFPTSKNNRKAIEKDWRDSIAAMEKALPIGFPVPACYAHPIVLDRMIRVIREGRAQTAPEALAQVKEDLKALTADVQVEQEEHDEVVAIKPMFLLQYYR